MRGVFLDQSTLTGPVSDRGLDVNLEPLSGLFEHWDAYQDTPPELTVSRIHGADVIISNKVVLDQDCLQHGVSAGLICIAATGTNNVDLGAATRAGIAVTNVRGYATPSVTEHVFALMLALIRRLPDYQRLVAAGRWQRSEHFCLLDVPLFELAGRTLGIIGYGELGQAVARVARAFDMQILIAARPGTTPGQGRVALEQLLAEVDVLSLHCPLSDNTANLIGAEQLALMKPDALLINTARGGIVDEQALALALRSGRIGGAAVDVLAKEPPGEGCPLLSGDIPNLIVTPHIAWASRESRQRLICEIAANIQAWMRGEARNRVV